MRSLNLLRTDPDKNLFALGQGLNNLGFVQNMLSQEKEAVVSFEEAIEVLSTTKARGLYSRALANLAAAYMLTGRLAESQQLQEESLAIKRDWFGQDHIETGYSVANLSFIYQEYGDYEKAEALKQESIEIFSQRLGANHPNIGVIMIGLAANMASQKKYTEAETTYLDALSRVRNSFGPDSMREVSTQNGIGQLYAEQGRFEEAAASFGEALRISTIQNSEHSDAAIARAGMASLPESALTTAEREQYFATALEQLEKNEGLGTTRAALIQMDFAELLAEQGDDSRAQEIFQNGLTNLSTALPAGNPKIREQADRYEELFGEPPP